MRKSLSAFGWGLLIGVLIWAGRKWYANEHPESTSVDNGGAPQGGSRPFVIPQPRRHKPLAHVTSESTSPFRSWGEACPAAIAELQTQAVALMDFEKMSSPEERRRLTEGFTKALTVCPGAPDAMRRQLQEALSACAHEGAGSPCGLFWGAVQADFVFAQFGSVPPQEIDDVAVAESLAHAAVGRSTFASGEERAGLTRRRALMEPYVERALALDPQSRYGRFSRLQMDTWGLQLRENDLDEAPGERYLHSLEEWLRLEAGLGSELKALDGYAYGPALVTALTLVAPAGASSRLAAFDAFVSRVEVCGQHCREMKTRFERMAREPLTEEVEEAFAEEILKPYP